MCCYQIERGQQRGDELVWIEQRPERNTPDTLECPTQCASPTTGELTTERDDICDTYAETTSLPVDLGVTLYPNEGRSNLPDDGDLQSSDGSASSPSRVSSNIPPDDIGLKSSGRSASSSSRASSIVSYRSYDTESDDDSFMPRRKHKSECKVTGTNWEFLDDVSIEGETLETEDVTESVMTFGAENYSVGWSEGSKSLGGDSTGSGALLLHLPRRCSRSPRRRPRLYSNHRQTQQL